MQLLFLDRLSTASDTVHYRPPSSPLSAASIQPSIDLLDWKGMNAVDHQVDGQVPFDHAAGPVGENRGYKERP